MLTKAQIKKAAINLCKIRGIDPESRVAHSVEPYENGYAPAVLLYSPAWKIAVAEIEQRVQIEKAINMVLGYEPNPYQEEDHE